MAVDDLYQLTVFTKLNNNKMVNRFHFRDDGSGGSTPEADLLAAWIAQIQADFLALICADVTVTEISCRRVYPIDGPTFVVPVNAIGVHAGDASAPQTCFCQQWFTSIFTRSGRGRTFVSGIPEGEVKDGLLTNTYAGLVSTWAGAMIGFTGAMSFVIADPALGSYAQVNDGNLQTWAFTKRSRRMQQA